MFRIRNEQRGNHDMNTKTHISLIFRFLRGHEAQVSLTPMIGVETEDLSSIPTSPVALLHNSVKAPRPTEVTDFIVRKFRYLLPVLAFHFLVVGCTSTIVPHAVESTQASFDANVQNSGFLGFEIGGGAKITSSARGRYNALIEIYGRDAKLVKDQGLSPNSDGSWSITKECLVKFLEMSDWKRAGLQPITP